MNVRMVFLSSTFRDLAEYREEVYKVLQGMDGWHCVRMEDFGARDREADEFCQQRVAECHLFVGILGPLYGSIHKPSGLSYTEREYRAAVAASKPRLLFLTPEAFPVSSNLMESSTKQRKQRAFRNSVRADRIVDANWSSPHELATSVVTAIRNWEREQPQHEPAAKPAAASSHAPDQQLRDRYLRWLAQTYGRLRLLGIKSAEPPYIELNLDDIYVPLEAVELLPEQERRLTLSGKHRREIPQGELPATRPVNLKDVLKVGERIVIIGGPGSGKSTVLRYIAWTLAESLVDKRPELARDRLGLNEPLPMPVVIPLHAFAEHRARHCHAPDPELSTLAACVWDYVTRTTAASDLPLDFFKSLLSEQSNCLVMLDGLDEVASEADRELVCRAVENLAELMPHNRYIVTSRPAAYTGLAVIGAGFRQLQVRPLQHTEERDEVEPLVRKLYQAAGHPDRIDRLLGWLDQLETRYATQRTAEQQRLIDSPLMVRMVAIVDLSGEKLPEQRAELYGRFVDALLRATYHADATVRQALEQLGGPAQDQRQWLALLAYAMHTQEAGTRSLEENRVRELLCAHLAPTRGQEAAGAAVQQFIAATRSRGGLVEVRSGPPDRWSFTHQPFQEFMTAVYLADILDEVGLIAAELEKDGRVAEVWWQEVTLLLLAYLGLENPDKASRLARRLARLPDPMAPSWPPLGGAVQLAAAERVGIALTERPGKLPQLEKDVAERLTSLLEDTAIIDAPAILRAATGCALAHLRDPRAGVDLRADGLPDIVWCPIPAGPFTMGSSQDKKKDPDAYDDEFPQHLENSITRPYFIGRYPVTNAQFSAFVQDGGYAERKWLNQCWSEAGRRWLKKEGVSGPERYGQPFDLLNHPVVGISWYEALAFCRWLTEKLRVLEYPLHIWHERQLETVSLQPDSLTLRLPTEAEWEKAARGTDGLIYPWVGAFAADRCNMYETGIDSASAVGIFPTGDSPYGCADMAGNVWEWCGTKWVENYKNYDQRAEEREKLEGDAPRVLRGGSWDANRYSVRCASRDGDLPPNRNDNGGFRVVGAS